MTPVCPAGVVVSGDVSVVLHYRAGSHLQNNMDVPFIVAKATQELSSKCIYYFDQFCFIRNKFQKMKIEMKVTLFRQTNVVSLVLCWTVACT